MNKNNFLKICLLILFGMTSAVLYSCKKEPDKNIEVASITLKQTYSVAVGESIILWPTITPNKAINKTVVWTSFDESIATVDATGKVTAIAVGTTTIEAKAGDKTTTCKIIVTLGVVINGVTWATRNVDAPGTFAASPESSGMFYQWNRKTAWAATGSVSGWDATIPEGTLWKKDNDPSPNGWRVPTYGELQSLFDEKYVTSQWTNQNGVKGRKFTDKATGNSLFFPAAGYRDGSNGIFYSTDMGFYWSNTSVGSSKVHAFFAFLYTEGAWVTYDPNYYRNCAQSVRPVLAK